MIRKSIAATTGEYRSVALLSLCVALNSFGMGVIGPVLPLFVEQEYGVSATEVGIAIGLFGAGRLFTGVPAGLLAQRYGRKPVLALGAGLNFLGALMVSVSFNFWWLTGWRFMSGLGSNAFSTVTTVYLRDESTAANRGRILSTQELSILSAQIVAPLMGGYIASVFGLRMPLYTQAVLMALSLAVVLLALPESRWRERQEEETRATRQHATVQRSDRPGRRPRAALLSLIVSPAFIFVGLCSPS